MTRALGLVLVLACGKSDPPRKEPDDKPAADAACLAKAKALEPFIASIELERASHEINYGWNPVTLDRPALRIIDKVDNVTITPTTVEAFDASERNHSDNKNNIGPNTKPDVAKARFARTLEMKVDADRGPDDVIRLDIDQAATWGEVVRVVDAATAAGYQRAVFAFEATSKLVPPPGVEPLTTTGDAHRAAEDRLDALREQCKPYRSAMYGRRHTNNPVEDATKLAAAVVAGLQACNCAVDLDEVRAVTWKAARWHQAHTRVPVEVTLGAATTIEQPAATPWTEAHAKVVGATGAVKLVAR